MTSELLSALFKRRSAVDSAAKTWESCPAESSADARHLAGLAFNAPCSQEWLQHLDKTQEEDMLLEALADELAERGSRGPLHIPGAAPSEESSRLEELTRALVEMRRQLASESEAQGTAREDLARREAEIRARGESLEAEMEKRRLCEEARRTYPQPSWLENLEGTMNIGVVGNAGVGKSLLINKLRRLPAHARGWAPVGVNETTREPTMYTFPDQPKVRLWDLPGAGTAAVPSSTYVQDMGLRYFDKAHVLLTVLIVTAGRFTLTEIALRAELQQHNVPFLMVRTKVDIDVWNNRQDNGLEKAATLAQITEDLKSKHGVEDAYLVSSRDLEAYDMPRLVNALFPSLQRQVDPAVGFFEEADPAWNDAWMMPAMFSTVLAGLQGRWRDAFHAVYFINGTTAHVTLAQGQAAIVPLVEANGCIWWCSRWYVKESDVFVARRTSQLRWFPQDPRQDVQMVWTWLD